MNNYFETEARVDASRTDTLFRLSLLGMLELIEDAETMHTEEMKVDAPTLYREDGAFWVITRNFLHIERVPVWEENLIVGTYPLPPSLMRCERQNYIKDQKGNLLVASKTEWCVLDAKTRKLRPVSGLTCYPKDLEHKKERVLISSLSEKEPEFLPADLKFTHIVRCSDLDFNHHVNNAKYVNFIYDCYPSEFCAKGNIRREHRKNKKNRIFPWKNFGKESFLGNYQNEVSFRTYKIGKKLVIYNLRYHSSRYPLS